MFNIINKAWISKYDKSYISTKIQNDTEKSIKNFWYLGDEGHNCEYCINVWKSKRRRPWEIAHVWNDSYKREYGVRRKGDLVVCFPQFTRVLHC